MTKLKEVLEKLLSDQVISWSTYQILMNEVKDAENE